MARLLAILCCAVALVACSADSPDAPGDARGPRVVVTIPPFAMIMRPLIEPRGTVTTLLAPGASPHTHDLRPSDLRAVEGSLTLLYGHESLDGWAADLPAPHRMSMLGLLPPSAQQRLDTPHRHGARSSSTASGPAIDPHFWTDPMTVTQLLPALADTLCALDTAGCPTYRANADTLATRLSALDGRLEAMLAPVRDAPVMLAQPFFRYFLQRYGPRLVAVVEPQPASEPSPRRIQALARQAREAGVQAILTQHQLPPRSAQAVAEAAGIPIQTLDPLGGTGARQTYETLLQHNAQQILGVLEATATSSTDGF